MTGLSMSGARTRPELHPSTAYILSFLTPGLSRSLSGSSSSGVDSMAPLPPKDKECEDQTEKIQTAQELWSSSISSCDNALQPTEIWRRRSACVKSDHSIVFGLKLEKSNGSTASQQEQPTKPQRPRSNIGQRKPIPSRPPPQTDSMGNKISKLGKNGSRESPSNEGPAAQPQPSEPVQRLLTPEYLRVDTQQPLTSDILSSVSPFTPPEDKPSLVLRTSESRSLATSHGSSDATIVGPTAAMPENEPAVRNNLLRAHFRDGSDAFEGGVMESPRPQNPLAAARILTPQTSSGKTTPLGLPSPSSHAAYFPTIHPPGAQGMIVPGPALGPAHFECYQSHRLMRGSNNRLCPVSCMICQRQDTDKRWRCTWCCLSACASCMKVLHSVPGKDLHLALEKIRG